MNWVLTIVFAVHILAFLTLGIRRREWRYLILAGTFVCLSLLYGFRSAGIAAGASRFWTVALRTGAILCSAGYLILTVRGRPQTRRSNRDHEPCEPRGSLP